MSIGRQFGWMALGLLTAVRPVMAQQDEKREGEKREESAEIPVRYAEGMVHGFLELRAADGTVLANGDLLQVPRDREIQTRMVFHFRDDSVFEEAVTFTQHGVFKMLKYHLVQSGPAFADDLDATLSASGEYAVKTKSHKDGEEKEYAGTLELPPDVYNGMPITIAKNLAPGDTQTVHIVAFTPKPRLIGLELAPSGAERIKFGRHSEAAVHYKLKPKLGTLVKVFASLLGKAPPDSDVWIVTEDVPAFVRFEGPMYSGPVWRLDLTSPDWPE